MSRNILYILCHAFPDIKNSQFFFVLPFIIKAGNPSARDFGYQDITSWEREFTCPIPGMFVLEMKVWWSLYRNDLASYLSRDPVPCSYINSCGIRFIGCWSRIVSRKTKVNMFLCSVYMFWYSRFRFRNLKDANFVVFSWCTITSAAV